MYDPAVVDAFDRIVDHLPKIDDAGGLRTEALERISRMVSEPPEREPIAPFVSSATFAEQILQLCDLSEAMGGHATLDDLTHLLAVMIAEGDRLRAEALPLAGLLFPEDSREDAGCIELLWRHAA